MGVTLKLEYSKPINPVLTGLDENDPPTEALNGFCFRIWLTSVCVESEL